MAVVPYEPFRQLANMRRDFDNFFTDFPLLLDREHHIGGIRVDVHETDAEIIASCDIPGLESKEDVSINIENNILMISGNINRVNEVKEENVHRRERYSGRFQRSVSLPSPVSHEGISASYKNGVLEVKMPKLNKDTKKKIDVTFH